MSFTNDPCNPIDRVRITVGDTQENNEYLADQWYVYLLEKNSRNETRAAIEAAQKILAKFTSNTREKVDQVEVWGNDKFDNYLVWLKEFIESPSLSGLAPPMPFAGGISKSDMEERRQNSDNKFSPISQSSDFTEDSDVKTLKGYWRILD